MRVIAIAAVLFLVAVSAGYGSSGGIGAMSRSATPDSGGVLGPISCGAPGDCAAAGLAWGSHTAVLVSETKGHWGKPIAVPGLATLSTGGGVDVTSISCAAPGECAAGGSYNFHLAYSGQAFVVSETNGRWSSAIEVPGTATLNAGTNAEVDSVSCAAAGECAAGGFYAAKPYDLQAFVVSETNGHWGNAIEVPGTARLGRGGYETQVYSLSCAAAGECAAGGDYTDRTGFHAFVANETNGRWGSAIEVPGTPALATGGFAAVDSISCAAVGECAASGEYSDDGYDRRTFVVSETNGSWGDAIEVPGMATLNPYHEGYMGPISCGGPGDCAAGGDYLGAGFEPFVVGETNGSWDTAIEVPGMATLNAGGYATVYSISCGGPDDCTAGGDYSPNPNNPHSVPGFVVSETNGSWGDAITVGSLLKVNSAAAGMGAISCAAPGSCTATAGYDRSGRPRAYVVSETNGSWGRAIRVRFPGCVVPWVYGNTTDVAETMLTNAHCGIAKITNVYSDWKKGLVLAQHPVPGKIEPSGEPVALTVSKGQKP